MALTPPKRLFHIPSMSTVIYVDVVDSVKEKGYAAVSHVWGNQQMYSADELGINSGVDWMVPLSDPGKMERLIATMLAFEKEYCWFDVLCMPQDKQDEINLEIPFMRNYYSGADITFVLSDKTHGTTETLGKWSDIMRDAMDIGREFTNDELLWMTSEDKEHLDFHEDEWFDRVWTFQEAVLSQRLIMVNKDASYVDLSIVITQAGHLHAKGVGVYTYMFGPNSHAMSAMDNAISAHKSKTLDLARVLSTTNARKCYKNQDRFYGVLGILGYTGVLVDYNTDMEELNKTIVQYSYSKGDISWMAIGGNVRDGFLQPMYTPFRYLGLFWKENEENICNAFFGNMLAINSMLFGEIVNVEGYGHRDESEDLAHGDGIGNFIAWISLTFAQWGFSDKEIFDAIIGFVPSHEKYNRVGARFVNDLKNGRQLADIYANQALDDFKTPLDIMDKFGMLYRLSTDIVVAHVRISLLGTNFPLVICGRANIGDDVLLINLHDIVKRNLGIISSGNIRKGVCLLPQIKMSSNKRDILFSFREFVI